MAIEREKRNLAPTNVLVKRRAATPRSLFWSLGDEYGGRLMEWTKQLQLFFFQLTNIYPGEEWSADR